MLLNAEVSPYWLGFLVLCWSAGLALIFTIRELDDRFGHIQEVIVQPFHPKPGTKMSGRSMKVSTFIVVNSASVSTPSWLTTASTPSPPASRRPGS